LWRMSRQTTMAQKSSPPCRKCKQLFTQRARDSVRISDPRWLSYFRINYAALESFEDMDIKLPSAMTSERSLASRSRHSLRCSRRVGRSRNAGVSPEQD
jgi:hypothetical protein